MEWVCIYLWMCKYTGDFCNRKYIGSGLVLTMPRLRSCHYIRCISTTPSVEMLPLHLSQLFTGISGFSCLFLSSPADTLVKSKATEESFSIPPVPVTISLLQLLLGQQVVNSFSFFQEPGSSAFIQGWRLSMCLIYFLFVDIFSFSEMKQAGDQKVLQLLGGPFLAVKGSSAGSSLQW